MGIPDAVAANTAAPPKVLARLALHERADVRTAVAGNRAAPAAVLEYLVKDASKEVLYAIAGNQAVAPELLQRLSTRDGAWNMIMAGNPTCPAEVLVRLSQSRNIGTLLAVAANPKTPQATLARFWNEADSICKSAAASVVRGRNAVSGRAARLVGELRAVVAANPSSPRAAKQGAPQSQTVAAFDRLDDSVRTRTTTRGDVVDQGDSSLEPPSADSVRDASVADFPQSQVSVDYDTSSTQDERELLIASANDSDFRRRAWAAVQLYTPAEELSGLARDSSVFVRHKVAQNPRTPAFALSELAEEDIGIQVVVANNPSTPLVTLEKLVGGHPEIRKAMSVNPAISGNVLLALLTDSDPHVRMNAALMKLIFDNEPELIRKM